MVVGPGSVTQLPPLVLSLLTANAVKTLYAVGDDLSLMRSAFIFDIALNLQYGSTECEIRPICHWSYRELCNCSSRAWSDCEFILVDCESLRVCDKGDLSRSAGRIPSGDGDKGSCSSICKHLRIPDDRCDVGDNKTATTG